MTVFNANLFPGSRLPDARRLLDLKNGVSIPVSHQEEMSLELTGQLLAWDNSITIFEFEPAWIVPLSVAHDLSGACSK